MLEDGGQAFRVEDLLELSLKTLGARPDHQLGRREVGALTKRLARLETRRIRAPGETGR